MNILTPYEKALSGQLNDLSLPGVDLAWKDMEKLLGKEKDDKTIIPPPQKPGCGIGGLLLGLLLIGTGFFLYYNQDQKNIKAVNKVENDTLHDKRNVIKTPDRHDVKLPIDTMHQNDQDKNTDGIGIIDSLSTAPDVSDHKEGLVNNQSKIFNTATTKSARSASNKGQPVISHDSPHAAPAGRKETGQISNKRSNKNITTLHSAFLKKSKVSKKAGRDMKNENNDQGIATPRKNLLTSKQKSGIKITAADPEDNVNDTTGIQDALKKSIAFLKDTTVAEVKIDTPVIHKSSSEPGNGSKEKNKKRFHTGVGVAVNQALPVNGETISPVNNYGRKRALTDYIPSLYFRLYKEKKWFIQSEFRYGAPQYVKEFIYRTNIKLDTFQAVTRTSYLLKKTYYHQFPVSFNYLILPGWSLGTGIIYNNFTGAVSERSIRRSVPGTVNDTLISVAVVNDKKDSSFVKNSFQWLLESQYKWRRFSIGARYAQGLQPYIKYIDPVTQLPASKKNNSIQLFIRYEIWNSRKKMVGYKLK